MAKSIKRLEDLQPDLSNLNQGTKRGADLIRKSLQNYGAGRSIVADRNGVVIAGNHVLEEALDLGFEIEVVRSRGDKLIVHQREDLDMSEAKARELAIADNRASEVGLRWDAEALQQAVAEGVRVTEFFFQDELDRLLNRAAEFAGNAAAALGVPPELPGTTIGEELKAANRPDPPDLDGDKESDEPPRSGLGTPVIGYQIIFDNTDQQTRWFAFLRYLKGRYPDEPTIGARLDVYLREQEAANPALAKNG